jgi:hypothetical protein
MIRPGWKVYASDGAEVGQIDEVAGDENVDIFDGLAVAASALAKPKYVSAESVTTITEGRVNLSISQAEFEGASEFLEPATSEEIEPSDHHGLGETIGADVREVAGKAIHPVERQQSVGLIRRIDLFFKRMFGR